jgi:hypothetical protein
MTLPSDYARSDHSDSPACTVCGGPLGVFLEDQPDWPTGPLCGNCYQSQQLDDEIAWQLEDQAAEEDA